MKCKHCGLPIAPIPGAPECFFYHTTLPNRELNIPAHNDMPEQNVETYATSCADEENDATPVEDEE